MRQFSALLSEKKQCVLYIWESALFLCQICVSADIERCNRTGSREATQVRWSFSHIHTESGNVASSAVVTWRWVCLFVLYNVTSAKQAENKVLFQPFTPLFSLKLLFSLDSLAHLTTINQPWGGQVWVLCLQKGTWFLPRRWDCWPCGNLWDWKIKAKKFF